MLDWLFRSGFERPRKTETEDVSVYIRNDKTAELTSDDVLEIIMTIGMYPINVFHHYTPPEPCISITQYEALSERLKRYFVFKRVTMTVTKVLTN